MPVFVKYINCFYQCKTRVISDEEWNIQSQFQKAEEISLLPISTQRKQGWNVVNMGDHLAYHCVSGSVKVPKRAKIKTLKTTKKAGKVKTMQPQNKSKKVATKSIKNQEEIREDKTAETNFILRPVTDSGTEDLEANVKNGTSCLASTQPLDTKTFCVENPRSVSKVCETEIQSCRGQQISLSSHAQTTSVKSRIPLGLTRRRKSIARRKSFLKKGHVGLSVKRFSKELEVKASSVGENTQEKKMVVDGEPAGIKTKPSFLCLTKKKDAANSTFVKNELEKKCPKKAFTKDFSSKVKPKSDKTLPQNTSKSLNKEKTSTSQSHSRKQWNETGVKAFEGMIFSSIFAFSDELRESTESIRVKLQTLNDSLDKSKSNTVFPKKNMAFSKEWRKNNEDILNSNSEEIAGIFQNLRKVESDLKTIDQAITSLAQLTSKDGINARKGYKVIQKGIK